MENENGKRQGQAKLRSDGQRTLTVSPLYRQWGPSHRKHECKVPSIRLNGKWLAALGIRSGQKVRVTTKKSVITIAPIVFDHALCRDESAASARGASHSNGMKHEPRVGAVVKYSRPAEGEADFRFLLREHNADRVTIELICNERIRPIEVVAADEVEVA